MGDPEMLSAALNLTNAVIICTAVAVHCRKYSVRVMLRYFTVLSNLFCAAASLAAAAARLLGTVPETLLLVKFVSTVAVTVTLLTVLFFLGPTFGYKLMFSGPDLYLHLLCPLLALAAFFIWDRPSLSAGTALLGVIPVLLYGIVYLARVVFSDRWEDFYGFNKDGKWPLSFSVMLAASAVISLLLALA